MGFMDGFKKGAAQGLVKQLNKKVDSGDKDAMVQLGTMFFQGENIQADPDEAYRLFRMAADLGAPIGLNNVGVCHEEGLGVEKNLDEALAYYNKAVAAGYTDGVQNVERVQKEVDSDPLRNLLSKAEAGEVDAQAELGARYAKGIDVMQDHQQAIKWLTPAAQASNLNAQFYLGRLYAEEMNLASDGISWLEKAAEGGSSDAQGKLGIFYATGKCVEKDLEKAVVYLRQAALQGNKEAANNLGLAEKQIAAQTQPKVATPAQQPIQQAAPAGNNCTQCGAVMQSGAKFCGGCGAKVEQVPFCTGCGAKMVAGSKFCGDCGTAVGGSTDQAVTTPVDTSGPTTTTTPSAPKVNFDPSLESAYDFADKAEELIVASHYDMARAHILRGLELAEDVRDLIRLAAVVCKARNEKGLDDQDWGRQIYEKAEQQVEDAADLRYIAEDVWRPDILDDGAWSRSLLAKAVDHCDSANSLNILATATINILNDYEWAKELIKRAERANPDADDLEMMAKTIARLHDADWARELFSTASDIATEVSQLASIACCIKDELEDRAWAQDVMEKALDLAESVDDFEACARKYGFDFEDKETARTILEKAVSMARDAGEFISLASVIEAQDYLGDKEWAKELLDRSEEMINNGECDDDDEEWLRESLQETREAIDNEVSEDENDSLESTGCLLEKFNGIDSDLISIVNLRIGYTQGELNAKESPDYEDGFKAENHVYWQYTIVMDEGGDTGCDWLLLDWANPSNTVCLSGDEEACETIAGLIEPTTGDMFGSTIPAVCFQSVLQSVLDEPDGYDFIEETLENVGGCIEVEEGDKIEEAFVNSLFALYVELDSSTISVENGKLYVNGQPFDINAIDEACISEKKYAAFSEDVMGY